MLASAVLTNVRQQGPAGAPVTIQGYGHTIALSWCPLQAPATVFLQAERYSWNYYNHSATIHALAGELLAVRKVVYETLLDVSFARTGGCIAVVRATDVDKLVVEQGASTASVI